MARPRHPSGNLPAEATTFVGRRRELGEIRKKLATARMVSLVGPGGVGKTRLAVRVGTELARSFADGAWFVELGEVTDRGPRDRCRARSPGPQRPGRSEADGDPAVSPAGAPTPAPLDNCEHLLEAAAQLVSEVLRAAPEVRVITTSREPLQVAGEYVVPVPPLELPPRRWRRTARSAPAERSRHAVHRACGCSVGCVRAHGLKPRRGRRPFAGGSTACLWRSSLPRSGPES